jgi:hypothetical protein
MIHDAGNAANTAHQLHAVSHNPSHPECGPDVGLGLAGGIDIEELEMRLGLIRGGAKHPAWTVAPMSWLLGLEVCLHG